MMISVPLIQSSIDPSAAEQSVAEVADGRLAGRNRRLRFIELYAEVLIVDDLDAGGHILAVVANLDGAGELVCRRIDQPIGFAGFERSAHDVVALADDDGVVLRIAADDVNRIAQ